MVKIHFPRNASLALLVRVHSLGGAEYPSAAIRILGFGSASSMELKNTQLNGVQ